MKSSEGQRRRLFLLELAQGLIMPQVRRQSLIPIVQALIRLAMTMVLQLLVSHRRLNRQWVKRRICCLCPRQVDKKVRLEGGSCRKRSQHLTSCVGTIPINPGPIFTNIIADSDFTYRLRFWPLQSRLCGSSCIAAQANDFHHRFTRNL